MNELLRKPRIGTGDLDRFDLPRRPLEGGACTRWTKRGRGRYLEPVHLPEGHLELGAIRRPTRGGSKRVRRPEGDLPGARPKDIQDACDILEPVYDRTDGKDGYVSLEVSPNLAYDTLATVEEAERLVEMVDRPNLFVKIPATLPGLAAIEEMIARGASINVTLIFSLQRYRAVTDAYIRGLSDLWPTVGTPQGSRAWPASLSPC